MIKKIKLSLIAILVFIGTTQAQKLPMPSPYAEVMQTIGLTDVTIKYSRPGVKDRKIFGGLEAYGEVWRTGANAATKIELSTDANIGGTDVKAGTYSIFSIPGETEWKVILNSDAKASERSYDAANNVAEITVKGAKNEMVETMSFSFDDVKENQAQLVFEWETVKWMIPIKVAVEEQALANIKDEIDQVENAYGVYNSSARYYMEHDQDLDQALEWAKKSVSIAEKFWNVYTLAQVYHAKGDLKNAIATAERSLELSKEADYQPYVKRNMESIEKWKKEGNK